MQVNIELLTKLCLCPGAPGREATIRNLILSEIKDFVDDTLVDHMGNLICIKKGKSDKRLMVAAHMDEISFMVSHIDNNGFARLLPLGGFDPKTLTAQRVIVHGKEPVVGVLGSKPIHLMTDEERSKPPKISDYYIDFGRSGEEVKELVSVGDVATRERDLIELGDTVSTKSLDNRVSVYILIETLKQLKKPGCDFYAVFTVQEEVGLRGATTASHFVKPDLSIGLDTTIANDLPGIGEHEVITQLGKGAAIKYYDSSVIPDQRMINYLEQRAEKHDITTQKEILPRGGTDTGAMQRAGDGSIAGCISIPTRHIHSVVEMCHKEDILTSIKLLTKAVEDVEEFGGIDRS